jgi:hypothetical protein
VNVRLRAICLAALLALGACGSSGNAPPEGSPYACAAVDASATCVVDGSSFEASIQPILAKSCLPACHDGSPDAAWPLTNYDDVQAWTTFVAKDILRCSMPPPGSGYPMKEVDREAILNWISCDAPP